MTSKATNMYRTRTQIDKMKDETINKYEHKVADLEGSIKFYENLISNLHKKLTEKEKLIILLTNEQDENSVEFEKMCKDNQCLKKQLSEMESRMAELQCDVLNLTEINQTITEESEEFCINNSINNTSILKMQMVELEQQNGLLQRKVIDTIYELNDYKNKTETRNTNKINTEIIRKFINKTLSRKIRKQKKLIRNLQNKYRIFKNNNKKLERKQLSQDCLMHSNLYLQEPEHREVVMNNNKIETTNLNRYENIKIIGDSLSKNLGINLKHELDDRYKICCDSYSNAPLQKITSTTQDVLRKENNITLVMVYNNIEKLQNEVYISEILEMIKIIENKNIQLIFTNLAYEKNITNRKYNQYIHKYNSFLNSLALYNKNVDIINTSEVKLKDINVRQYKEIVTYFLKMKCLNEQKKQIFTTEKTLNQII